MNLQVRDQFSQHEILQHAVQAPQAAYSMADARQTRVGLGDEAHSRA